MYRTQPPTAGRREQPQGAGSGVGAAVGLLMFCAGSALLGAWLLSWLGGGSIGPWWLLAGMAVSYGLGLFFRYTDLDGPAVVLLFVIWVPAAAWMASRAVVYYWFPDLFGNQDVGFVVVFAVMLLVGVASGLVKAFSSR